MSASTRDLRGGGTATTAPDGEGELDGQMIGGYRITREIGRGGMGVIYLGEHPTLGKRVAVKVIPAEHADNEELRRRFVDEARRVASVASPHVVQIHDLALLPDGRFYMAMEFLEGESLAQRLERGPLSLAEATDIAMQALTGLAAIHERGLVHRDVKPSNLFLAAPATGKAQVKVLDFGLAKLREPQTGGRVTLKGSILGTPGYMSPEQARGEDVDARADVYACGVVLYEMFASRVLFDSDDLTELLYLHATAEPPALANVPSEIASVVMRALAKDLRDRYADAAAMQLALAGALSAVFSGGRADPDVNRDRRTRRRRAVLIAIPVTLAAGVAIWSMPGPAEHAATSTDATTSATLDAANAKTVVLAASPDAAGTLVDASSLDAAIAVVPGDTRARDDLPRVVRPTRTDAGMFATGTLRDSGPVTVVATDAGSSPASSTAGIDPLGPAPPAPAAGEAVSMRHPHLVWRRLHDFIKGRAYAGHLGTLQPGTPITVQGPMGPRFYRLRIAQDTKVTVVNERDVSWDIVDADGWPRCESTSKTRGSCVTKTTGDHVLRVSARSADAAFTITLTHAGTP